MKNAIILIFSIVLILTFSTKANSAFTPTFSTLKDTDMHWSEDAVQRLKDIGVMNGYNGYINPDSIITRGEFTALITRIFGIKPTDNVNHFTDINSSHIFFENICAASDAGIIDGFADNTFRPDNMITREEIMLILSRVRPGGDYNTASFTDIESDYQYLSELSAIKSDGIINGYPDGSFGPNRRTTRAEAATMVLSAANKYLPSAKKETVIDLCTQYLPLHFSNDDSKDKFLTGEAKTLKSYVNHAYKYAEKLGYHIENTLDGQYISSAQTSGPFSEITFEYYISNTVNGVENKCYKGESKISLITRNGETKIYNHATRIKSEKPVNLTWEVFSNPPDSPVPGVNVLSPSAFSISPSKNASSVLLGTNRYGSLYLNSTLNSRYTHWAKKNNYDIWAMYKTDFTTETANRFLNNPEMRLMAVNELIKNILTYDLSGINFDFENMLSEDRSAYTNHVKEISAVCHALGAVVSVDITVYLPSSLTWSMCYDRDALSKHCDYIILMAYDQYYSGSPVAGPVSGIPWTEKCIQTTLNEVEPDKLILGIPFYIRCWEVKSEKVISSKAVSMSQALKLIEENNAQSFYDTTHGLTKYTWQSGGKEYVLWLENAKSIRQRVQFASKYNLAGVASWRRGFETADIWNVISDELN